MVIRTVTGCRNSVPGQSRHFDSLPISSLGGDHRPGRSACFESSNTGTVGKTATPQRKDGSHIIFKPASGRAKPSIASLSSRSDLSTIRLSSRLREARRLPRSRGLRSVYAP